jgi:chemotaxis protein MotB
MKKRMEKSEGGVPGWMVTFTNLMILLLAFFIVLVNMSVTDQAKKRKAFNSLFGSFGFQPGGRSAIGSPDGTDITMSDSPLLKESVDLEQLRNIVIANGLETDMKVKMEPERIILNISDRLLFDRGSFSLREDSIKYLSKISGILKNGPGTIELRGYTDLSEGALEHDQEQSALYLSTKRAMAAFHYFVEKGMISAERVVAHGFGPSPIEKRNSMEGKEWQGQVDIIVNYKQEIPYKYRIRQQDNVLDFKGFLFKGYRPKDE